MNYRIKSSFGDNMKIEELSDKCKEAYSNNDFSRLIDLCDEILSHDLNNQRALGYKVRGLYLMGRCEEALEILDSAIKSYPDNFHYLEIKAEVLMNKREYGKAIECFCEIFRIGVGDEDTLDFIKREYETCLNLRIAQLIENEKYVDAWKCYNRQLKLKSADLGRPAMIDGFRRIVKETATKFKKRHYYVKASSDEAKLKLVRFLNENGFEFITDSGVLLFIDVVDKTCRFLTIDEAESSKIISESKFYDKVNYYPRGRIVRKEIFSDDGKLAYEGYTLDNAPYGFGKAFFADGSIYRDGIFDMKGIVQGKEYYPSGHLRFEGQWCLTGGYGPNVPCEGSAYDEDGKLIYSGKFEIKRGGVGWPMILNPKGFKAEQKERPKIEYYKS